MPMVYNGEMSDLEREGTRLLLECEIHQSKIASIKSILNAQYEQAIMEADYKVLTEGGTFDDLEALYMEAEESQEPKKVGIIRTIISTIAKKLQEFGDWILNALGQNGERLQKDVPDDAAVEEDGFTVSLLSIISDKAEGFFSFAKKSLSTIKGALEGSVDTSDVMKITGTITAAAFGLGALVANSKEEKAARAANAANKTVTKKNLFDYIAQWRKIETEAKEVQSEAQGILGLLEQGKGTISAIYNDNLNKHMDKKQARAQKKVDKKAAKDRAAEREAAANPAPAAAPVEESASSSYGLESYDSLFIEAGKTRSVADYINELHTVIQSGDKQKALRVYNAAMSAGLSGGKPVSEKAQKALSNAKRAIDRMPDTPKQQEPQQNAQPAQKTAPKPAPQPTPQDQSAQPAAPAQPKPTPAPKQQAPQQNAQPAQKTAPKAPETKKDDSASGGILSSGNETREQYSKVGKAPATKTQKEQDTVSNPSSQKMTGAYVDNGKDIPIKDAGSTDYQGDVKKQGTVSMKAGVANNAAKSVAVDKKTGQTKEDMARIKECEAALNNQNNIQEYQNLQKAGNVPKDKKGNPISYEEWIANTKVSYSKRPGEKIPKDILNDVANAAKNNDKYKAYVGELKTTSNTPRSNNSTVAKSLNNATVDYDDSTYDAAKTTMRAQVDTAWYDKAIAIVESILQIVMLMIPASFKCIMSSASDMCSWIHSKASAAKDKVTGKKASGEQQPAQGADQAQQGGEAAPAPEGGSEQAAPTQPTGESAQEPDLFGIHAEYMEYVNAPSEDEMEMFSSIIDNL